MKRSAVVTIVSCCFASLSAQADKPIVSSWEQVEEVDGITGTKTRVLAELICDPKGSVAPWLVNLFQKSWPYNTITSLRRQTQKRHIQEDARLSVAMGQAYD